MLQTMLMSLAYGISKERFKAVCCQLSVVCSAKTLD